MKVKYVALKRTAEDRKEWQRLLRAGSHTPASQQVGWLVGWGLTALLTQNRSYRACRFVGIFYSKL